VVRTALEDVGLGFGDFPCFVGKKLKFKVSFYMMNVLKDVDNLLKFILDAVLYSNNKFIFDIHARKACVYHHAGDEETIIKVKALDAA
jgi:Holliday junction resolvase RusA-like endonuclease